MTPATLLHRQIHPSWVQQGRVTSQAFKPTPKDEPLLSVCDGDQITAEAAWAHYSETLGKSSVGVLSVSLAECIERALQVRLDPEPFPQHAVIDFSGLSGSQIEKVAKHLKHSAEVRGWQHPAGKGP